jgi:hypothetical protein
MIVPFLFSDHFSEAQALSKNPPLRDKDGFAIKKLNEDGLPSVALAKDGAVF